MFTLLKMSNFWYMSLISSVERTHSWPSFVGGWESSEGFIMARANEVIVVVGMTEVIIVSADKVAVVSLGFGSFFVV